MEDALAFARQASLSDPALLANALNALGDLRLQQGRPAEAERLLTEAFRLVSRFDPPLPLRAGVIEANLARANHRNGRLAAADEHFQSALATLRTVRVHRPSRIRFSLEQLRSATGATAPVYICRRSL